MDGFKKIMRFCALLLVISSSLFSSAWAKPAKFTLEAKNGLISLNAEDANFKDILFELEKKTGVLVKIFDGVPDKHVSIHIDSLPICCLV